MTRETEAQLEELRKNTAGKPPIVLGAEDYKKGYSFKDAVQDAIRREQAIGEEALKEEIANGLELEPDEYAARLYILRDEAADRVVGQKWRNVARGLKRKTEAVSDRLMLLLEDRPRVFDWMEGGAAKFGGAVTDFWITGMNRCEDAYRRAVEARVGEVFENKMKELELTMVDLYKRVSIRGTRGFFGVKFPTRAQLIGIYVLSRDKDARRSLINGNFRGAGGEVASEWLLQQCMDALSEKEKALGDFIFDDLNRPGNYERFNNAHILATGEGITKVEDYVRIFRIDRNPYLAEID